MPMIITPKEPTESRAFHISEETPRDLWDAAKLCAGLGLSLNAKWYDDPSPSAPDHTLCVVTIRPVDGQATAANTLSARETDWIIWDGINLVIKTHAEIQAVYNLQDEPAVEPTPEPDPTPEPEPEPEPAGP